MILSLKYLRARECVAALSDRAQDRRNGPIPVSTGAVAGSAAQPVDRADLDVAVRRGALAPIYNTPATHERFARAAAGIEETVEPKEGMPMPDGATLTLRTDGASRGNPGHAAAGVVIEDEAGEVIARGKLYLGLMTSNQAEYRALILGLKALAHYHPGHVRVYMDSDLVVQQMNGAYQVKHPDLKPLWLEALSLVAMLPDVTFAHVPRARNALADRLANQALDERAR